MTTTESHSTYTPAPEATVKTRRRRWPTRSQTGAEHSRRHGRTKGMAVVGIASLAFGGVVGYGTGNQHGKEACATSITPDSIIPVGDPQVLTAAQVTQLEAMVNSSKNAPLHLTDSALERAGLLTVMDQLDSDDSRTLQAIIPTGPKGDGIHVLDVGGASKLTTNVVGFSDNQPDITSLSAEVSSDYTVGKNAALVFQVGTFTCTASQKN